MIAALRGHIAAPFSKAAGLGGHEATLRAQNAAAFSKAAALGRDGAAFRTRNAAAFEEAAAFPCPIAEVREPGASPAVTSAFSLVIAAAFATPAACHDREHAPDSRCTEATAGHSRADRLRRGDPRRDDGQPVLPRPDPVARNGRLRARGAAGGQPGEADRHTRHGHRAQREADARRFAARSPEGVRPGRRRRRSRARGGAHRERGDVGAEGGRRPKPPLGARPGKGPGIRLDARAVAREAAYEWAWSTDEGKTWHLAPQTLSARAVLSDLPSGTTCWFRFRATTRKGGTSNWSNLVTFVVP